MTCSLSAMRGFILREINRINWLGVVLRKYTTGVLITFAAGLITRRFGSYLPFGYWNRPQGCLLIAKVSITRPPFHPS